MLTLVDDGLGIDRHRFEVWAKNCTTLGMCHKNLLTAAKSKLGCLDEWFRI